MERECSNISQLNTFTVLIIDCGSGNSGAVGLRFVVNNSGRIENVAFYENNSLCALLLGVGTEGVFRNIAIVGFMEGIKATQTSLCIFEDITFCKVKNHCVNNKKACMLFLNSISF